jgi:hypothetical protein
MSTTKQTAATVAAVFFATICLMMLLGYGPTRLGERDDADPVPVTNVEPPKMRNHLLESLNQGKPASNMHAELPRILVDEFRIVEQNSIKKLQDGLLTPTAGTDLYQDVTVSMYVHTKIVHLSDGSGQEIKYYAAIDAIKEKGLDFIVYSAGNAGQPSFELELAKLGAKVFSFDCTIDGKKEWTTFTFHKWCIGEGNNSGLVKGEVSAYVKGNDMSKAEFYPLREIRRKLGHKRIDVLKMDIEGFEWDMMEREIVNGKDEDLPDQLLFELHGEGTGGQYVPVRLSKGKNRHAVNRLLLALHDRNYRLMNWEKNNGDGHAAEFAMIRLPGPSRKVSGDALTK